MAQITHAGGGLRTVINVLDMHEAISRITPDAHPLITRFAKERARDINPHVQEDILAAVNNANAFAENAAAPAAVDTVRWVTGNWCQLMKDTAQVSDTQQSVQQYGIPGTEMGYQEPKKVVEMLRNAEATLISDQVAVAPAVAVGSIANMAAMGAIIVTNTDLVGTPMTQGRWDALMTAIVSVSGGNPVVAYMDAVNRAVANAFAGAAGLWSNYETKTVDVEIQKYHSDLGKQIELLFHHLLPQNIAGAANYCYILDPSLWIIKEAITLERAELAYLGGGPGVQYQWQWAPLCKAEAANGRFA